MTKQYELVYFDVRARGEVSRLLFALAGQKYVDTRLASDVADSWLLTIKQTCAFGQLPQLIVVNDEDNSKLVLHQSAAINRYLARVLKLNGNTAAAEALIDSVVDQCIDIRTEFKAQAGHEAKLLWMQSTLPLMLQQLQAFAVEHGGPNGVVSCNDQLTIADVQLYHVTSTIRQHPSPPLTEALNTLLLLHAPLINTIVTAVARHAGVSHWLNTRPVTACWQSVPHSECWPCAEGVSQRGEGADL